MKVTDDIVKAMQKCVDHIGSKNAFARKANVSITTISKYLTHKTKTINDDTWVRMQPLLRPFLPKESANKHRMEEFKKTLNLEDMSSNEKILLDAFAELTNDQQDQKLIEIVELARANLKQKNEKTS